MPCPSSGRSSAPQLGRSLVGPAHAPESRASTCTTWRGPTATAGRAIHSSAVWAVAGRWAWRALGGPCPPTRPASSPSSSRRLRGSSGAGPAKPLLRFGRRRGTVPCLCSPCGATFTEPQCRHCDQAAKQAPPGCPGTACFGAFRAAKHRWRPGHHCRADPTSHSGLEPLQRSGSHWLARGPPQRSSGHCPCWWGASSPDRCRAASGAGGRASRLGPAPGWGHSARPPQRAGWCEAHRRGWNIAAAGIQVFMPGNEGLCSGPARPPPSWGCSALGRRGRRAHGQAVDVPSRRTCHRRLLEGGFPQRVQHSWPGGPPSTSSAALAWAGALGGMVLQPPQSPPVSRGCFHFWSRGAARGPSGSFAFRLGAAAGHASSKGRAVEPIAPPHFCIFGRCLLSRWLQGSSSQLCPSGGSRPPGWAPHQPRQEWTDPMWWAWLGHRSRSLPAWYCDQPHHLLHVAGGANWWCGFLRTADCGSARRQGPPAPGCHRGVAGAPNRALAAAPLRVLLQSGVCHPGYPVNLPGLCHGDLWHCCETLLGSCVHWAIVCRGLASSLLGNHRRGLGLRHACIHAPAGYASSVLATQPLCQQLDPDYLPSSAEGAIQAVNRLLPAGDQIPVPAPPPLRQRQLSQALDKVLISRLTAAGPGREAFRAHFQLLQQPGAGAWLHAPPSPALGLHVAGPLFKIMVRLRLRLQVALGDAPCPMCDGVADSYGDHARVCPCGGDRTKRHHSLRTLVAARSQAAGFHTEVEKPGLLPPRPEDGGAPEDGGRAGPGRRPADVWIGNWGLLGPAALDLAVTSGMRLGSLAQTAANGQHAVAEYEVKKCSHQNTLASCGAEGLQFLPIVAEACGGGWGPIALQTFKAIATAVAARSNEPAGVEYDRLLQCLSVALQRENARAVLRRVPG